MTNNETEEDERRRRKENNDDNNDNDDKNNDNNDECSFFFNIFLSFPLITGINDEEDNYGLYIYFFSFVNKTV